MTKDIHFQTLPKYKMMMGMLQNKVIKLEVGLENETGDVFYKHTQLNAITKSFSYSLSAFSLVI